MNTYESLKAIYASKPKITASLKKYLCNNSLKRHVFF